MQGYPYQRLSDPRQQAAPTPAMVGQLLVNKGMTQGASPMAMAAGGMAPGAMRPGDGPGPDDSAMHEGAEPSSYEAQEGDEMSEQGAGMGQPGMMAGAAMPALSQRLAARGMEGDYDPATEHSPSATRVALDTAVRSAMGRMQGSERTMTPSATRETLARLGMPPLEIDLALKTGQLGDSGMGG